MSIIHNWTNKSYPTLQIQVDICLWQFMLVTSSLMPFNLVDWIHLFCTSYIALKLLHLGILLCLLCAPTMHLSSTDEDTLKVISDFSLESAFAILFQWDKLKERYFLLDKKYLIFIFLNILTFSCIFSFQFGFAILQSTNKELNNNYDIIKCLA